jgi:hypothetical protein
MIKSRINKLLVFEFNFASSFLYFFAFYIKTKKTNLFKMFLKCEGS